ncbi:MULTISPECIES: hypothetical protein [unclassified Rhizobium]|uniref:hypothetical protein n=1 Tax=unclassified Rhizobium TaxID=2613769 RepID=UPI000DE11EFF|nr:MULTISPECIES: hypothetical protein [unclassified Rhizobium]MBP2460517.1 hypothetical protein [Rhizobium sp. PvP014]MBP2527914.1 hypothetical protein [Rhizobium sp. PvP099]
MDGTKAWYQSKTIWGALIAVAAPLAHVAGVEINADAQGELADILVTFAGAFGGLLALYGRIVASAPIHPTGNG